MPFVYSTCSNSGTYCDYGPADKNTPHSVSRRRVVINGGHRVAQQRSVGIGHIWTPKGVVTEVTEDELEFLLSNKSFQRHMQAGHITYDKKQVDPAKRADEMALKDGSAPITREDFEESEASTPETKIYKDKKSKGKK